MRKARRCWGQKSSTIETYNYTGKENAFLEYSTEDIKFIEKHYLTKSDRWIGFHLKRSGTSIGSKRKDLSLFKYKSVHTPNNSEIRAENSSNEPIMEEIHALVNFIETTSSDILRDIANRRRKELLKLLNR